MAAKNVKETAKDREERLEVPEELRKIFEGNEKEKENMICWGYRDYWPKKLG